MFIFDLDGNVIEESAGMELKKEENSLIVGWKHGKNFPIIIEEKLDMLKSTNVRISIGGTKFEFLYYGLGLVKLGVYEEDSDYSIFSIEIIKKDSNKAIQQVCRGVVKVTCEEVEFKKFT